MSEPEVELTEEEKTTKPAQTLVVLDATTLTTLMACGRLTDFRFNRDFQSAHGKGKALEMGQIVHTYMETKYGNIIKGFNRKDSHQYGMAAAQSYSRSPEVSNTSDEDIQLCMDTCEQYNIFYANETWVPLEVETVKKRILYEDEEVKILWKAKLDLLCDTNQGIYPVDHKTMSQRRETVSLNNQFMGQCIVTGTRVMFVNKIGFQKTLKPNEKFVRTPVTYSFDRLAEWQGTILPYWAKQFILYNEMNYWPPNFTHCDGKFGYCQFKGVCEAERNLRESYLGNDFVVGDKWDPKTND